MPRWVLLTSLTLRIFLLCKMNSRYAVCSLVHNGTLVTYYDGVGSEHLLRCACRQPRFTASGLNGKTTPFSSDEAAH